MSLKYIEIVPYNPQWPKRYEKEALKIQHLLGNSFKEIHHIGSTAVPGLSAKDHIDIICVVDNLSDSLCLKQLGYVFKGEINVPLRYYYSKNTPDLKVNLHVITPGNGFIELNLCFRNYLRQNTDARLDYESLKIQLLQDPTSFERSNGGFARYTLRKDIFIKSILKQANFEGITLNFCTHHQEWEHYHHIKKTEIFNRIPLTYNRNHPDLISDHHYHFVMYKGIKIICIAQIEFLDEKVAVLRTLATDAKYKKQGYATHMIKTLEQWIIHQKRSIIKLHATLTAESFYRKLGYIEMDFDDISILKEKIDMGKYLPQLKER